MPFIEIWVYFQDDYSTFAAMRRLLAVMIITLMWSMVSAQEKNFGSWTTLNLKYKPNDTWSAYGEFQARSLQLYDMFYYTEIKGGVTYSFLDDYSFTLGTGLYSTFKEGEDYHGYTKQQEFRVWQQFIAEQSISSVELEHRFRSEQRFTDSYANRFRYRLNASIPINKKKMEAKTLYASIYDELFFADKIPHFSRNRFQMGGGYIFNEQLTLQIGWLRQVDYLETDVRRKNYLFTSLSFTLKNKSTFRAGSSPD